MGQYTRYKSIVKISDMVKNLVNVLTGVADIENTTPTKWFNTIQNNIDSTHYNIVLESTANVDSYITTDSTQTYRIALVGSYTGATIAGDLANIKAYIGSSLQISIDTNENLILDNSLVPIELIDITEDSLFQVINSSGDVAPIDTSTVDRSSELSDDVKSQQDGRDLHIVVTSRGFAFTISSVNTVNQRHRNSMICVQRPVNPSTGIINTSGTAPVFCLYQNYSDRDPTDIDYPMPFNFISLTPTQDKTTAPQTPMNYKGAKGLFFIVVRESDILNASKNLDTYNVVPPSGADNNNYTPGTMYSLSFDWTYPITFDDSSYVMKYPFGFMTSRNTYIDEMDLVSFVNSAVFPYEYDISIGVYGESSNRTYKTSFGVDEFGVYKPIDNDFLRDSVVGSRIAILSAGGGI